MVVADKQAFETTHKVNQFWFDSGQAVMQSFFEVQGRSLQYVQETFIDGIGTLQGHLEASQRWLQTLNKPQDQQEPVPSFVDSGIEAQKRTLAFLQRTIEHGAKAARSNNESMRNLTQTLLQKTQEL